MSDLLQPGQILDGAYEIVEFISKGGFGAVYRARQLSMDRDVAVKLLLPGAQPDFDGLVKRFRNEVKAVRNLRHPNTVQIFDFHETADGQLYFTMEYLEGRSLRDLIKGGEPISPRRCAKILSQALKSLAEAHAMGIIHRDIKPANIMLVDMYGEEDFVKVLDFGIAKAMHDSPNAPSDEPLTRTGYLVGTVRYMAPERIAGDPAGPYSDIYSLGLVGASLLMGQPLLGSSSRLEAMQMQMGTKPLPIPAAVENCGLGEILGRALEKLPANRYASAEEMLDELGAIAETDLSDSPLEISGDVPRWDDAAAMSSADVDATRVDPPLRTSEPRAPGKPTPQQPTPNQPTPNQPRPSLDVQDRPVPNPADRGPATAEVGRNAGAPAAGADRPFPARTPTESTPQASSGSAPAWLWVVAVILVAGAAAAIWYGTRGGDKPTIDLGASDDAPAPAAGDEPAPGLIEVRAQPEHARVKESGVVLGVTPLTVRAGQEHRLEVSADGFATKEVVLGAEARGKFTVELARVPTEADAGATDIGTDDAAGAPSTPPTSSRRVDEPQGASGGAKRTRSTGSHSDRGSQRGREHDRAEAKPEQTSEEVVVPVFGSPAGKTDKTDQSDKPSSKKAGEDADEIPVF